MNNLSRNALAARVELLQVSKLAGDFETATRLLLTATQLTCSNSTLAAKTLCFDTCSIFRFKIVSKYFAQGILVTELIVTYDFLSLPGMRKL